MKVLVLHGLVHASRVTTLQHTLSFSRHLNGCEVTYVHGLGLVGGDAVKGNFDLAIVTYELAGLRNTPFWKVVRDRIRPLLERSRIRVLMPQDDYSSCAYLDDFAVECEFNFVFTPLTRDLHMLYPRATAQGITFHEAFTGYWEESTSLPIGDFRIPFEERSVDLGQRVRHLPPQLGPAAQRKGELAIRFAAQASDAGFTCDVSTRDSDVLIGSDWWKFLGNTKFTVGRLGGASIADPRGRLAAKVRQLQLRKPKITYGEIAVRLKTASLPQGDFTAISPRLFECAAMGVCQILERAHYFNDFEPWREYIPLDPNMSNLDEVFNVMRDQDQCREIASQAEKSLITSGRFTYRQFIRRLAMETLGHDIDSHGPPTVVDADSVLFGTMSADEVEHTKTAARRNIIFGRWATAGDWHEEAAVWTEGFRDGSLVVESLTLPWCPALTHFDKS